MVETLCQSWAEVQTKPYSNSDFVFLKWLVGQSHINGCLLSYCPYWKPADVQVWWPHCWADCTIMVSCRGTQSSILHRLWMYFRGFFSCPSHTHIIIGTVDSALVTLEQWKLVSAITCGTLLFTYHAKTMDIHLHASNAGHSLASSFKLTKSEWW